MGGADDCAMANGGEVPTHVSSIDRTRRMHAGVIAGVYVDVLQ